jgi:hypothetical protein
VTVEQKSGQKSDSSTQIHYLRHGHEAPFFGGQAWDPDGDADIMKKCEDQIKDYTDLSEVRFAIEKYSHMLDQAKSQIRIDEDILSGNTHTVEDTLAKGVASHDLGIGHARQWFFTFAKKLFEDRKAELERANSAIPQSEEPIKESVASPTPENVFRRVGKSVWEITYQGQTGYIPDTAGMEYIAILLKSPDRSIEASALLLIRLFKQTTSSSVA